MLVALPAASADEGKCSFTNNGVIVALGDVNADNDCSDESRVSYLQYCDQGPGAGAGTAGVGVNGSDGKSGGAAAGASASCNQ